MSNFRNLLPSVVISLAVLGGCSIRPSSLERNHLNIELRDNDEVSSAQESIEKLAILSDTDLFIQFNNQMLEQIQVLNSDDKEKANLVLLSYINNVYSLTLSRLAADIGDVPNKSKEYMGYIAMLQTFADEYKEGKEDFQEDVLVGKGEENPVMNEFLRVEDWFFSVVQTVDN